MRHTSMTAELSALLRRRLPSGALSRFLAVAMGSIVLVGCGGGGSSSTPPPPPAPAVSLSTTSLSFGNQMVNVSSSAQSVTVTNSGNATLSITSITASGNFSQTNTCGTSLAAALTCTISVTFTPPNTGSLSGTVTLSDNASPSTQTVNLSGTGVAPAASVSLSSLTFSSQTVGTSSASQPVTLSNTGSAALSIATISTSGDFSQTNNCGSSVSTGGSCAINVVFTPTASGTRTGTLTVTDNSGGVTGSQQTVGLTGTGSSPSPIASLSTNSLSFPNTSVGTSSAPLPVTLTNTGNTTLSISNVAVTAGSSDFSETNCNGSNLSAGGSCTMNVTFTPTASGMRNGTLTITDNSGGVSGSTQTVSLTGTGLAPSNSVSVTVSLGPAGTSVNTPLTTITVCQPGTTNCTTIPNVMVDIGSVGLRVLSTYVSGLALPQVYDPSSGYPVYECVEWGGLSYSWGQVQMATVQIGGESASQVPAAYGGTANSGIPIQVISPGVTPPTEVYYQGQVIYNPCLVNPATDQLSGGNNDDSVASFRGYAILGVGNFLQDCGIDCTSLTTTNGEYLACGSIGSSTCDIDAVSLQNQVWNPVAAFSSSDTNGLVLQLASIPASGQATANGTLTFGIDTQPNNAIPNTATIYGLDQYGLFESVVFGNTVYSPPSNPGFIDSGSVLLYVSDPTTLTSVTGIDTVDCTSSILYCPAQTLNFDITVNGSNGASGTVPLSIANAASVLNPNPTFAAFNDLGANGGTSPANDMFDLGLGFFFGRTVFVGIAGTSVSGVTYDNGYWAF